MSAMAFFDDSWYVVWGSNNKRTPTRKQMEELKANGEIPEKHRLFPSFAVIEGVAGQRVLLSKSKQQVDSPEGRRDAFKSGWSQPGDPKVPPGQNYEGLFRTQLLRNPNKPFNKRTNPENPDNRQWQPELLVVDLDPDPNNRVEELWAWFTQNIGRNRGTYFGRLQHSDQNPDAEWVVKKIDLKSTSLNPKNGFVFVSANSLQMKHQTGATADRNGWVLVPVTPENETDPDVKNDIAVLYTKDGGETWNAFPRITPPPEFNLWEPVLVEHPVTGELFLYVRNRNRRGKSTSTLIVYSTSKDGGETWSPFEAMPLEVPSLRAHVIGVGERVVMVHHDFENSFAGETGARAERTGRMLAKADSASTERLNLSLFFSRTGKIGTFLPGVSITNDQEDNPLVENQRGISYPHMILVDDAIYAVHSSERSIKGEIIRPLPPEDQYLLLPRSAVEILGVDTPGWDTCPLDVPNHDYNRDEHYVASYCTYKATISDGGVVTVKKMASVGAETDIADYAADEMLQFQFDFTSQDLDALAAKDRRMALLTIGGPKEYAMVEIGRPGFADKVVYVQGDEVHVLGDYAYPHGQRGEINLFLHKDGVTLALSGNEPVTVPKPIKWQKIFFGYGYNQGPSYKENEFNPDSWFRFRSQNVKSRVVSASELQEILKDL